VVQGYLTTEWRNVKFIYTPSSSLADTHST